MLHGIFELKPKTALSIGGFSFQAFSGNGEFRNRRTHMCVPNKGPIPAGMYYIVDRPQRQFNVFDNAVKGDWFALYAKDRVIDDERWCDGVLRGNFRLHPKGPRGISEGCITLERTSDFYMLHRLLRTTTTEEIPGTKIMSYGTVQVW